MVSVVRAQQADIAAVAAYPSSYIWQQLRPFAFIFIAFGLLCAGGLAWAVAHISRTRCRFRPRFEERRNARSSSSNINPSWIWPPCAGWALRRWCAGGTMAASSGPTSSFPRPRRAALLRSSPPAWLRSLPRIFQPCSRSTPISTSPSIYPGPISSPHDTVDLLRKVIVTSHARPCNLHVEATERCFLKADHSRWMIALIRSMGLPVSIDDFGTGYSSLSCLQTLGLDALKIDKSFVETIGTDGATSQVVPHIIGWLIRLS